MNATIAKHTFQEGIYQVPGRVLVLVPNGWDAVSDADQQLLARILSSVKLSLASVQIMTANSFSAAEASVFNAKTILSFGVPFAGVDQPYHATTFDELTVVYADPVGTLDDMRKKNLWVALRHAFKL